MFKDMELLRRAQTSPIRVTGLVQCWNAGGTSQLMEIFPNQLDEMVGWLLDCASDSEVEMVQELSQAQTIRLVDREYAGGLSAFILTNPADPSWLPIEVNTED